jgi:hypothetical protein
MGLDMNVMHLAVTLMPYILFDFFIFLFTIKEQDGDHAEIFYSAQFDGDH